MRKSTTLTDKIIERDKEPDVPIIETLKDPATVEATDSVEVIDPPGVKVTLGALKLAELLVVVRVTTPLKLLMLVTVRMVLLEKPASTVRDDEADEIVKSGAELTVTAIVAE
jgi:hypothetical protein